MSQRGFTLLATAVFAVLAVLHLLRAMFAVPAVIGSQSVPVWFSYVVAAVLALLAFAGARAARR
jgi:hypothetical protein